MRHSLELNRTKRPIGSVAKMAIGKSMLVGILLAIGTAGVAAQNTPDTGLSGKVMKDHGGVSGGSTANPTARPDDDGGGIQRKAMKDHPGSTGGTTSNPRAKSDANSLQGAIMKDHPGVQ